MVLIDTSVLVANKIPIVTRMKNIPNVNSSFEMKGFIVLVNKIFHEIEISDPKASNNGIFRGISIGNTSCIRKNEKTIKASTIKNGFFKIM